MRHTFTRTLVALFLSTGAVAQEYQKDWSDGKLTWDDFTEREGANGISELKYYLGYHAGKEKHGNVTVLRNRAKCYMDRKLSWINPAYKTAQYLRYNQVIFDLVEIHRRRLQYELDRIYSPYELEGKFNHLYSLCNHEIDRFNRESNGGQDLSSIAFWEQTTSEELNRLTDDSIPEFEKRNFGYGLHAGFGAGFLTKSLGEHFTPTFNFMFGFDLAYRRSILYVTATLAGDKVKKEYTSQNTWHDGQRAGVAILDVSYGYAVVDNERIKLSPFAGFGLTEFTGTNQDDKENGLRMVDHSMVFGLNTDYKLWTRLKLVPNPYFGVKEKVETSIRARLYVTRASYHEDLQGYSINLTIGICGFGNMIRLK